MAGKMFVKIKYFMVSALLFSAGAFAAVDNNPPINSTDTGKAVSQAGKSEALPAPGVKKGKALRAAVRSGNDGEAMSLENAGDKKSSTENKKNAREEKKSARGKKQVQEQIPAVQAPPGMALVPGGVFMMGSPDGEGKADEHPVHRVAVESFFIDTRPVTVAEYRGYAKENKKDFPAQPEYSGDDQPVVLISWQEAEAYCLAAGKRLPTEAEWERAARGGKNKRFGVSDSTAALGEYFWFDANAGGKTHPAGLKKPNLFGLYDLGGNIWEWTADWYGEKYYESLAISTAANNENPAANPKGPETGVFRVLRGGSFNEGEEALRPAFRNMDYPNGHNVDAGFRCAKSVP